VGAPDPSVDTATRTATGLSKDGPDNQRLISHYLTKAAAEIELACIGREGVNAYTGTCDWGSPNALILMDMQMPEMDGYEATRVLRTEGLTVPVIALTAHTMADDRQRCLDAGCNDYLAKPIDRHMLIAMCAQHLADAGTKTVAGAGACRM